MQINNFDGSGQRWVKLLAKCNIVLEPMTFQCTIFGGVIGGSLRRGGACRMKGVKYGMHLFVNQNFYFVELLKLLATNLLSVFKIV